MPDPSPTTSIQVPIKHGHIYVEVHGHANQPTIIMLAGLGMQIIDWPTEFIHALNQNHQVITLDNRDMGLSSRFADKPTYTMTDMRDDVYQVADHLGIQSFTCIGFSMGGMIAQLVAAGAPHRVTAMVQLCSGGDNIEMGSSAACQQRMRRVAECENNRQSLLAVHMDDCHFYAQPLQLDQQRLQLDIAYWLDRGFSQEGYQRQWQAIESYHERTSTLENIRCKSLIIGAKNDPCIHVSHSYRAHELIANSQLVIIPEVGHWLHPCIYQPVLDWL